MIVVMIVIMMIPWIKSQGCLAAAILMMLILMLTKDPFEPSDNQLKESR